MKKQVKVLLGFLCFFFICVFAYSGYRMYDILHGYSAASKQNDGLRNQFVSVGAPQQNAAQDPVQKELELSPISVDFDALLEQNKDVEGWLYSEDTTINYVVVKGKDNDYYLRRFLDGTHSTAGTLFIDYLCYDDFSGKNTIIYGHNMHDGSMFASILSYEKQEYYDEHPVLYLNTPTQDYKIEVFSGFVTDASSDVYTIGFVNDEYYTEYLAKMRSLSNFRSDVEVTAEDRIITLSTCSYVFNNARYVVMGKLVPLDSPIESTAPGV